VEPIGSSGLGYYTLQYLPHETTTPAFNLQLDWVLFYQSTVCKSQCAGKMWFLKSPISTAAGTRALLRGSRPQRSLRNYGSVSQATTPRSSAFDTAIAAEGPINTWTKDEIKEIHDTPLMRLAFAAVCYLAMLELFLDPFLTRDLLGHRSPEIPQPRLDPDVHPHEHQNRRVLGRLFLLRPVVSI
jgi:hypothetical protein